MKTTPEHDEQMAKITLASVYPHYLYLDKLVDELAKGKNMKRILRNT